MTPEDNKPITSGESVSLRYVMTSGCTMKMIFTLNVDGYAKAWPYVQALILSEASYLATVKQAAARLFNITLAI